MTVFRLDDFHDFVGAVIVCVSVFRFGANKTVGTVGGVDVFAGISAAEASVVVGVVARIRTGVGVAVAVTVGVGFQTTVVAEIGVGMLRKPATVGTRAVTVGMLGLGAGFGKGEIVKVISVAVDSVGANRVRFAVSVVEGMESPVDVHTNRAVGLGVVIEGYTVDRCGCDPGIGCDLRADVNVLVVSVRVIGAADSITGNRMRMLFPRAAGGRVVVFHLAADVAAGGSMGVYLFPARDAGGSMGVIERTARIITCTVGVGVRRQRTAGRGVAVLRFTADRVCGDGIRSVSIRVLQRSCKGDATDRTSYAIIIFIVINVIPGVVYIEIVVVGRAKNAA